MKNKPNIDKEIEKLDKDNFTEEENKIKCFTNDVVKSGGDIIGLFKKNELIGYAKVVKIKRSSLKEIIKNYKNDWLKLSVKDLDKNGVYYLWSLVSKYKGQGIGKKLVKKLCKRYKEIYFTRLNTSLENEFVSNGCKVELVGKNVIRVRYKENYK